MARAYRPGSNRLTGLVGARQLLTNARCPHQGGCADRNRGQPHVVDTISVEAGCDDVRAQVASQMAAGSKVRPNRVEQLLHSTGTSVARGSNVFEEQQLAVWSQHAPKLSEGPLYVVDAAQHKGAENGVDGVIAQG